MSVDKIIGQGKYGRVLEIEDFRGKKVAYKIIKPENLNLTEIDILSRVKSPYLIKSLGEIKQNSRLSDGITMEIKENNISNLNYKDLGPGNIKRIIMSLIYGLECLHTSGFLHLDVKPSNCLFDKEQGVYTGYLSDFGFSFRCDNIEEGIERKSRLGTLKYWPYEILTSSKEYIFNDKSDVWSLGVTIIVFLGLKYRLKFNNMESVEEKTKKVKQFWDSLDLNQTIKKILENLDITQEEKIDLKELLVYMLEKDKDTRISSSEFKNLRFYKKNSFENSCYVSKPKEILYIPYTSSNVLDGINHLNKYFEKNFLDVKIHTYFLTIELFIRLMSISPMEISNQTLETHIQLSLVSALKYYKELKITEKFKTVYDSYSYRLIEYLNGDIAPNIYFSKAKYAHDLVLIKDVLFKNYNLISLYSYLSKKNFFEYLRQNYEYDNEEKDKINTFKDLIEYSKPNDNQVSKIENDRSIFSYTSLKKKEKLIRENISKIKSIRLAEESLRNNLTKLFKNELKLIKLGDRNDFYNKYFVKNRISITDVFLEKEILKFINVTYGVIKEDIFDKLYETKNTDRDFIIFKSNKGTYSLLHKNENNEMIHYFSNFNQNLFDYFKQNNIFYENNYELQTSEVCKINEICILFLIYCSFFYKSFTDFNSIFIEDETVDVILKVSYCLVYQV